MKRRFLLCAAWTALTTPSLALAQDHSVHDMPGMTMPKPSPKATKPAVKAKPKVSQPVRRPVTSPRRAAPKPAAKPAMSGADHGNPMEGMGHSSTPAAASPPMDHGTMSGTDRGNMTGMDHGDVQHGHPGHPAGASKAMEPTGTALPAGNAPAPQPPMDHYADRQFPGADMAHARHEMMKEQGGQSFHQVMFNLAEVQVRKGRNAYRWDGEAWFGGDINRLTLKSEGEGVFKQGVEAAEIQALYSRAIGPYFNFQAGIRHDFDPTPSRTYAVVGFEGLAPYWFEVEGAAFLSEKGDVLGRIAGY